MYSSADYQNHLVVAKSHNFTEWLYGEIKPYIKGNILEVGSGLGTYSGKIVRDFDKNKIWLSDVDPIDLENLKNKFASSPNISVVKIDLNKESDYRQILPRVDTIVALNVLEHLKDDISVLNNLYDKLTDGGNLIIIVPAHKFLFNNLDVITGHYRRYDREEILKKISKAKFAIKKCFYFNFTAIFGWYVNGNILKKSQINYTAMNLYNKIIPFFRFFEKKILRRKLGISLIVIASKNV